MSFVISFKSVIFTVSVGLVHFWPRQHPWFLPRDAR